jgi:hypothetical protein
MRQYPWSHSVLTLFEQCPHKYYMIKVAKTVVEPQSEQMMWGNRVHKDLELRLGAKRKLPESSAQWEPLMQQIEGLGGKIQTEQKMTLNARFKETKWMAHDAWLRCIIDYSVEKGDKLIVGDYKTGKVKEDNDQLKLFAATCMTLRPHINAVTTVFHWLKTDEVTTQRFERGDLPVLWQAFVPRTRRLDEAMAAKDFPKKPNGLCKAWCPVRSCEFNGEYRE